MIDYATRVIELNPHRNRVSPYSLLNGKNS